MKPWLYIAGPYSKPDPVVNTRNAIILGQQLRETLGVVTIVPHVTHFEHFISPREYEYWLRIDLEYLERCDALYRMEGDSSGADKEVEFMENRGKPVLRSFPEIVDFVRDWHERHAPASPQPWEEMTR